MLHTLKPAPGSKKKRKRVARGISAGGGMTAGRGTKGQHSRTGKGQRFGFEGGQMPLVRRVPKFGFKNFNRVEYKGINLDVLQGIFEKQNISVITKEVLQTNGYVSKSDRIKILGRGELKAKLEVTVHAFSASAKKAIEEMGGIANTI